MEKLTSTTDFVLERTEDLEMANLELYKEELINILNHANFLSQTLNISMFVPAKLVDGEWVVLEEPNIDIEYNFLYAHKLAEYETALSNVLFEGFELYDSRAGYKSIVKDEIEVFWYNQTSNIGENKWRICSDFKYSTIEDLVKYETILTQNAKKQIGLL